MEDLLKIIFIIIFVSVMYVIFIRDNKKETFNNEKKKKKLRVYDDGEYRESGTYGIDRTRNKKDWYHVVNKLIDDNINADDSDNINVGDYHTKNQIDELGIQQVPEFADSDNNVKKYIREYVLDGKSQCECIPDKSKSEYTRNEIDEYRNSQLEFRNKIYGTSSPAEDPVDRVNNITLNGGIDANGQTIADYYDNLVSN